MAGCRMLIRRVNHSHTHTPMVQHQEQFGIHSLAQGHLDMLTGGPRIELITLRSLEKRSTVWATMCHNATTGRSSNYLMFGLHPHLSVNGLLGHEQLLDRKHDQLTFHQRHLHEAHNRARQHAEQKASERLEFEQTKMPGVRLFTGQWGSGQQIHYSCWKGFSANKSMETT